jgi:flagellar motor protein MotB
MANWQDDPDLAGMRPRSGKTPWGRVLIGVMVVGCGTFGLAYYLPLYRAHKALADDHARLRTELDGVQQKLTKAETELKDVSAKRDALDEQVKKQESKSAGAASDASSLKGALETAVDKLAKKKLAAVGTDASGARVALAAGALFTAGKLEVSTGGTGTLCAVAKAAGNRPLRVIGVATDDDVPAALKSKFASAWGYTSAAAGEVAATLHEKCSVPGGKLYAEGSDGSRPASAAFSGEKPPVPRIELLIEAKP